MTTPLPRAVLVSVDYADILSVTLPRNAAHFQRIVVITSPDDADTARVVESVPNATLFRTDAFYRRGAPFNKGLAIEEGFDAMGREGWFVVMDADVLLPEAFAWPRLISGNLYAPLRRMLDPLPMPFVVPPDTEWGRCPLHPQQRELAGFFQIAHAADPVLRHRPWYPTDWVHAGGCDSEYQAKWPPSRRLRPPFEVLHLGPAGQNWCGRASPRTDGTLPPEAAARRDRLRGYLLARRGKAGVERFRHERLP